MRFVRLSLLLLVLVPSFALANPSGEYVLTLEQASLNQDVMQEGEVFDLSAYVWGRRSRPVLFPGFEGVKIEIPNKLTSAQEVSFAAPPVFFARKQATKMGLPVCFKVLDKGFWSSETGFSCSYVEVRNGKTDVTLEDRDGYIGVLRVNVEVQEEIIRLEPYSLHLIRKMGVDQDPELSLEIQIGDPWEIKTITHFPFHWRLSRNGEPVILNQSILLADEEMNFQNEQRVDFEFSYLDVQGKQVLGTHKGWFRGKDGCDYGCNESLFNQTDDSVRVMEGEHFGNLLFRVVPLEAFVQNNEKVDLYRVHVKDMHFPNPRFYSSVSCSLSEFGEAEDRVVLGSTSLDMTLESRTFLFPLMQKEVPGLDVHLRTRSLLEREAVVEVTYPVNLLEDWGYIEPIRMGDFSASVSARMLP